MREMTKQMEMFQDGGLKDEGGTKDPVSGNDVPPGATQEEVRDDIPAQLSEGEFVFPADVVRYIGLEKLMRLRQEAKMGLKMMEEMGQMGNADEATIPDDIPFSVIDINIAEDDDEVEKRAEGGVIEAANGFAGTTTATNPLQQRQPNVTGTQTGVRAPYVAPTIPTATAAPIGGFKYKSPMDTTKKATYTGLFGGEELTQGPDEYRTYVNDAGAEIQIPFKNGKILTGFSVPEGFKAKTDTPAAPKIQTARTKTTRVQEDQSGSDTDDELSALGGARTTIDGVEYAVQYNRDGTVGLQSLDNYRSTGNINFQKSTKEIADAIKTQTIGQVAQLGYMARPQAKLATMLAQKAGIKIPGIDFADKAIAKAEEVTTTILNRPKDKRTRRNIFDLNELLKDTDFDPTGLTRDKFENLNRKEIEGIQDALEKGIGTERFSQSQVDRIAKSAEQARVAAERKEKEMFQSVVDAQERQRAFQRTFERGQQQRAEQERAQQQGRIRGTEAGMVGFGTPSGTDASEEDEGFTSTSESFSGVGGDPTDYGATNKGAFITKKRPSKPKKMKRGGLASR